MSDDLNNKFQENKEYVEPYNDAEGYSYWYMYEYLSFKLDN